MAMSYADSSWKAAVIYERVAQECGFGLVIQKIPK